MEPSKNNMIALLLAFCMVFLLLTPTASALAATTGRMTSSDMSRQETERIRIDLSDGRVRDTDGFIGNENDDPGERGIGDIAGRNAPLLRENEAVGDNAPNDADEVTGDDAQSALGWIIAIIIVLAALLVVLALLPKKSGTTKQ